MRIEPKMKQEQIQKTSGASYTFNLDDVSYDALKKAKEIHSSHNQSFSYSVIARRAARTYLELLQSLSGTPDKHREALETHRAAQGLR